ncbi:MAG TPA: cupin domain-containing protein [Bauldia sp.]|nr:cupin domain-containing protein [Bauldia sp.]
MPKKIHVAGAPKAAGTTYPPPHDEPCRKRHRTKLGDAAGLTQFGVNLCRLPPGAWSAQRHWHEREDEFVYVLEGEVTLVTDAGEEVFRPGDCAGFKAGEPDGHCFQNRSDRDAVILEVGTRAPGGDGAIYPDIDLRVIAGRPGYAHADGTPYPETPRKG